MKRSIIKTLVLMVLVLVFALSLVCQSQAQKIRPIVLKGTYGVVGQDVCVAHWTTYPIAGTPLTYWTKTSTLQGIVTFNTDGTGLSKVSQVTMHHPIYTPIPTFPTWGTPVPNNLPYGSIITDHITAHLTYTIDPVNRTISQTISGLPGEAPVGQFTSGIIGGESAVGKWFTFTPFTLTGYVSADLGTILYSSISDSLESYTIDVSIFSDQAMTIPFASSQEVCQRTRVYTLIK